MKKSRLLCLLLATSALGALSSCGASASQIAAVQKAIEGNMALVDNKTAIIPGEQSELEGDANNNIVVMNKQLVNVDGNKETVTFEWKFEQTYVSSYHNLGDADNQKVIEFNYPKKGEEAVMFDFVGVASCGAAKSEDIKFTVRLNPVKHIYSELTIAQIYEMKEDNSTFKLVTNAEKGYWEANNPDIDNYHWTKVRGKVIYLSPDGNWGTIADGDKFIEIYSGSGTALTTKNYKDLAVGNYVEIRGELSQYKGNVQLAYINMITKVEKGNIAEPADFMEINEQYINNYSQFNGDLNRDVIIQCKFAGGVKNADGVATSPENLSDGARWTFNVRVGSKTLTIAYDYHTAKAGSCTLFAEMVEILSSSVGTDLVIRGTLRFVMDGNSAFTNSGTFQVTPYLAGHVILAK